MSTTADDLYMAVILLAAMRRFLSLEEAKERVDLMLDALSRLSSLEQRGRILLLLMMIEEDKDILKLIKRLTYRLRKKSPEVFQKLLPPKQKGFRTASPTPRA